MMKLYANKYEEIRLLGKGATGRVLLVKDHKTEAHYALKIFDSSPNQMVQSSLESFQTEFKVLKNLNHPSIAKVYEAGLSESEITTISGPEIRKEFYIATEYIEGKSLSEACEDLDISSIEALFVQSLRALNYLHNQKIYHLDIKPPNLLVSKNQEGELLVKLIDFGFANFYSRNQDSTHQNDSWVIAGSSPYVSPEIIKGEKPDGRSDLYSLACTFYDAFTGQVPFTAMSHEEYHQKHLHERAQPPSNHRKDLPDYIDKIFLKLLEKNPVDRYGSAQELIEDLNILSNQFYPIETSKTLISYLPEKGTLVGREDEFSQFKDFYDDRFVKGYPEKKPYLIVRGEEGVGKTRFLIECQNEAQKNFVTTMTWKDFMSMDFEDEVPKPCLVIGDDVKVDKPALDLISTVYKDEPFLAVFSTTDPNLPVEESSIIELKNLSQEQTKEYLLKATGLSQIPEFIFDTIYRYTSGNPLYLTEYIKSLFEKGFLRDTYGAWSQKILEDLGAEFEELGSNQFIKKRLEHKLDFIELKPESFRILKVLALLGTVDRVGLEKILKSSSYLNFLEDLIEKQIIESKPNQTYTFTNPITREIIRDRIDAAESVKICDAIADYLESQNADSDRHLFFRGQGSAEDAPYKLLEYAQLKKRESSYQESLESLLLLLKKPSIHMDYTYKALLELGKLSIELGKYKEAESYLIKLLNLMDNSDQTASLLIIARGMEQLGLCYYRQKDFELADRYYSESLQKLRQSSHYKWMEVVLMNRLAQVELSSGDRLRAKEIFQETWHIWKKELSDDEKFLSIRSDIDVIYFLEGDYKRAISYLEEFLKILSQHTYSDEYPITLYKLGRSYIQIGQCKKGKDYLKNCLNIVKARKTIYWIYSVYNELGNAFLIEKDYEKALSHYKHALALAVKRSVGIETYIIQYNLGHVLMELSRFAESQKYFEFVTKNLDESKSPDKNLATYFLFFSHLGLASILREGKKFLESKSSIEQAGHLLEKYKVLSAYQQFYLQEKVLIEKESGDLEKSSQSFKALKELEGTTYFNQESFESWLEKY